MLRAFARQRDGTVRVIPIILRSCQWKGVPIGNGETLSDFVALPKDGKPVITWPDIDTAFDNAVGAIRDMLKAGIVAAQRPQLSVDKTRRRLRLNPYPARRIRPAYLASRRSRPTSTAIVFYAPVSPRPRRYSSSS
jgi:hypothetical protein